MDPTRRRSPAFALRLARKVRAISPGLVASLFGLWWFGHVAGSWSALRPTRIGWLLVSDWGAHQLGWMFFRNDPWSFPVGRFRSLLYPVGSTLGFSDSIPIVALGAKLLSAFLPRDFQYIGPWLASCFMMQGWVGSKLAGLFWRDEIAKMLGGALFVTTPTLLLRVGHPSLCAHWVLLALVYLHLKIAPGVKELGVAGVLTLLSGMVHPYLAVMALVLSLSLFLRVKLIQPTLPWRWFTAGAATLAILLVGVFWALGYWGSGTSTEGGNFDRFGADLTSLFNSMSYSRYLPALPTSEGAYEGLAYVGGGLLVLILASLVLVSPVHVRRAQWRAVLPIGITSALLALFASSSIVRFGGQEFFKLDWMYAKAQFLVRTFRSSGRFIWPIHYLCITFAVGVMGSTLRRHRFVGVGVLSATLALQMADLNIQPSRDKFKTSAFQKPQSATWELARGDYEHIALYPPQIYSAGCGAPFEEARVYRLAYLANTLGMTINSAYLARLNLGGVQEICWKSEQAAASRHLDDRTIYIPSAAGALPEDLAVCGALDGYAACVASSRPTRFSRAMSALARVRHGGD
jgi:Family of unknown function (DUF6311)